MIEVAMDRRQTHSRSGVLLFAEVAPAAKFAFSKIDAPAQCDRVPRCAAGEDKEPPSCLALSVQQQQARWLAAWRRRGYGRSLLDITGTGLQVLLLLDRIHCITVSPLERHVLLHVEMLLNMGAAEATHKSVL